MARRSLFRAPPITYSLPPVEPSNNHLRPKLATIRVGRLGCADYRTLSHSGDFVHGSTDHRASCRAHFAYPHASWIEVAQKPVLALLAEFVAYMVVGLYMILLVEGKYHTRFWTAIRWNWPGIAGLSLVGVGVLMLGFDALGRFLPMPKTTPFDQFFERPMDAYLTVAFAITLGPLMEEIFFRGFLYPVIARRWERMGNYSDRAAFRADALCAVSLMVGGADHYFGRRGAYDGAGRDQIGCLKLYRACRLQCDAHGVDRSGYGRLSAHGQGRGAGVRSQTVLIESSN